MPIGRKTRCALITVFGMVAMSHAALPPIVYVRDVQPIWNRNCVKCHDYGKPGEKAVNLAPGAESVPEGASGG